MGSDVFSSEDSLGTAVVLGAGAAGVEYTGATGVLGAGVPVTLVSSSGASEVLYSRVAELVDSGATEPVDTVAAKAPCSGAAEELSILPLKAYVTSDVSETAPYPDKLADFSVVGSSVVVSSVVVSPVAGTSVDSSEVTVEYPLTLLSDSSMVSSVAYST
ncbi:hypothetical protein LPJ62_006929, partial [Coemansia sp. RSA 2167]